MEVKVMKKIYEKPFIEGVILFEDVVRCSGAYAPGDDYIEDGKDLPLF